MTSSNKDKAVFRYLLSKSLDGTISPEETDQFNTLLSEFPDLEAYYFECLHVQLALHDQRAFVNCRQSSASCQDDMNLLEEFGEYEKTAPAMQIAPKENPSKQTIIQKVIYEKPVSHVNKVSLFAAALSIAAVLAIVVFFHFVTPAPGVEVATLADQINARWADSDTSMKAGSRLVTGEDPLLLRSGIARLRFDNNAVVTVEGPAEFTIISEDRVRLLYGRLYSTVPQEAIGFSVVTPKAIVIDLGTEFGVQVDFHGTTELHVTKGKTTLVAGQQKSKGSIEVSEGSAQRVSGVSAELSEIPCNQTLFVRTIDSANKIVWRGEPMIDLADIVGGGNGCGTGRMDVGINPVTGVLGGDTIAIDRWGSGSYMPVPQSRYIDGVFVPAGQHQENVISSQGHLFSDCPASNNAYYIEIVNSRAKGEPAYWLETAAGQGIYGTTVCAGIFMHANLGITFDLKAIREDYAGAQVTHFVSEAALSYAAPRQGNADVWVLVDGQVRYSQRNIQEKGRTYPIDIELRDTDRFLTLITTDGGDVDYLEESRRATDSDWMIFLHPGLRIK
jgi:hypothetical protein